MDGEYNTDAVRKEWGESGSYTHLDPWSLSGMEKLVSES